MHKEISNIYAQPGIHWLPVSGDAMRPTLMPGDYVAVNVEDKAIGQGGIFALLDKQTGETLIKRLTQLPSSNSAMIQLINDNPKQPVDEVFRGSIDVLGRVVGRMTRRV